MVRFWMMDLGPWWSLVGHSRCWGQFLLFMTRMRASNSRDVIDYVYVVVYSGCLVLSIIGLWRDRIGCDCGTLTTRLQEKPHAVHIAILLGWLLLTCVALTWRGLLLSRLLCSLLRLARYVIRLVGSCTAMCIVGFIGL